MANDIKYDIIADATRFGNGVRAAEQDAIRLQKTINRVSSSSVPASGGILGSGGKNGAMIVQQLAFAAEDAATQFGTRGLAGAMMAAGNNITFAASMINPTIGVIASLTSVGIMSALTYLKIANNAKTAANDIGVFTDRLREQQEQLKSNVKFKQQLADIRTDEKASEERKGLAYDIEQRASAIEDLKRQAQNLEGVLKNARDTNSGLNQEYGFVGQWMFGSDTSNEENQLKKLRELLNQEEIEIGEAKARMSQLKEESPQIQEREKRDKSAKQAKEDAEDQKKLMDDLAKESMTAQDRYLQRIKEIKTLKDAGKITDEQSAKYQKFAADQLEKQVESQRESNRLLSGAMDIRSAEAYGVMAKAEAMAAKPFRRFTLPQLPQEPKPIAETKSIDQIIQEWFVKSQIASGDGTAASNNSSKESLRAEQESAVGIKRIGDILERRPSIPIVGLN